MGVYIRVMKIEQLCCPKCGSRRIVGLQQEYCHCGQCGMPLQIQMPQDQWQRVSVLWENPVPGAGEKEAAEEVLSREMPERESVEAREVLPGNQSQGQEEERAMDGETEEELEFELEDAGMIFRPDLEEAEWEFEPVYEQLSFFPFPE